MLRQFFTQFPAKYVIITDGRAVGRTDRFAVAQAYTALAKLALRRAVKISSNYNGSLNLISSLVLLK